MLSLIFTLLLGFLAGFTLQKIKVPGGMMLGSVIVVAILKINTTWVEIPAEFRFVAQCIAGAYIGAAVNKNDLRKMRNLLKPVLTLLTGLFLTNLLVGFIIYLVSPLNLLTAMLSAVPGGLSDMPLIAADMGADAPKVAVMQFVRLISGIAMVPLLVKRNNRESGIKCNQIMDVRLNGSEKLITRNLIIVLSIALVSGYIGNMMRIAAGALLFSMLAVAIMKLFAFEISIPIWFKRLAQLFSGAYIGSHFSYTDFIELKLLIIPALILVLLNIIACFVIGSLLHHTFKFPLAQAILSSSPAGASDMALIASDIGVSGSDVAIIQIIRLIVAVALFPQLINLIIMLV